MSLMFCHYISCMYSYRLWNILTVLLTVILSHIPISFMFCYYISCIYSYRLWNLLTLLLTVILSHIHIPLMFFSYISCIYSYRLWNLWTVLLIVTSSRIFISLMFCYKFSLYIQLQNLKYINSIGNRNIVQFSYFLYIQFYVSYIHSFINIRSDDRSKASSKMMPPHSAIQSLLLQMRVFSPVPKFIQ